MAKLRKRTRREECPNCHGEELGSFGPNLRCTECGKIFKRATPAAPAKNPAGAQLARGAWVKVPGGRIRIRKTPRGQALEYQAAGRKTR